MHHKLCWTGRYFCIGRVLRFWYYSLANSAVYSKKAQVVISGIPRNQQWLKILTTLSHLALFSYEYEFSVFSSIVFSCSPPEKNIYSSLLKTTSFYALRVEATITGTLFTYLFFVKTIEKNDMKKKLLAKTLVNSNGFPPANAMW